MSATFAAMKRARRARLFIAQILCALLVLCLGSALPVNALPRDEAACAADRLALEDLQRDAFLYMWEDADPNSGMAHEATYYWDVRPVTVGGTGFGVAAIVVAADRGWITREQTLDRLLRIARFLRDKTQRQELHGAFPHWINGSSGQTMNFGEHDSGADLVETSLLLQGLLIARAYFNGPGSEAELRDTITEIWQDVDWNWFTNGEENGLYWHWDKTNSFSRSYKILGYNECLITYVLAMASPTRPISRTAYDYWTSGRGYQPKKVYGYDIEAALPGAGPLFLAQYSFIGLDPRRMADAFTPNGYFVRNVKQVLSNRGYCLQNAPARNRYSESFWGLSASHTPKGYMIAEPKNDTGTVAPTAALSSLPYTPHYSLQALHRLHSGELRESAWGRFGPYDGVSLRDNWISDKYLAIDQLPMVCMVENYRSGLLWDLFMADPDVRRGLAGAGIAEPRFASGFPEAVVTLKKKGKSYVPDAYDLRRHPETGLYTIPFWAEKAGEADFLLADSQGVSLLMAEQPALAGRNYLTLPQFIPLGDGVLSLTMRLDGQEFTLPLRLH